jgi:hypothetical protein
VPLLAVQVVHQRDHAAATHEGARERQAVDDVERHVDPALRNTVHHAEEYRRVWTAHALNLRAAVAA